MQDKLDLLRRVVELIQTMEEGLQHMVLQFDEMRIEESLDMLEHIVQGMISVEEALTGLVYQMPELGGLDEYTRTLQNALVHLLNAYLENKLPQCRDSLVGQLIPTFQVWQSKLQEMAQPLFLS